MARGYKRGWDSGRDVETITPIEVSEPNGAEKVNPPETPLSTPAQRIIADLRKQLAEAKARIAELEGEQ